MARCADASGDVDASFTDVCGLTQMQPYIVAEDANNQTDESA